VDATSSLRVIDATDVDGNDTSPPAGMCDADRHFQSRENERRRDTRAHTDTQRKRGEIKTRENETG